MATPGNPIDTSQKPPRTLWAWASGTFFGIGFIGKGGGTVASVVTVVLWWVLAPNTSSSSLTVSTAIAALLATVVGIFAADIVAGELGKKDPSEVVLDEVAGQLIALIGVPFHWKYALASLILFRIFDILKPPPVRQLERLKGGLGIMMDDVAAGCLALLCVHLLIRLNVF
ncbi:MAG TPA: phosphatidylglycerophosphatase A [Terriglobales bacterium]|nr:phosphatidylglycerophosphatase A [Terriglobales bacterium]